MPFPSGARESARRGEPSLQPALPGHEERGDDQVVYRRSRKRLQILRRAGDRLLGGEKQLPYPDQADQRCQLQHADEQVADGRHHDARR